MKHFSSQLHIDARGATSVKTSVRRVENSQLGVSLLGSRGLKADLWTWANRKDPKTCQTPLDQASTLSRIVVPALGAALVAFLVFPPLAIYLATLVNNAGVFAVLSQDSSQFVQNFLTVGGLLFSILVGQTYYFMYQQQEAVYYALFAEVTEAKSLLEQTALLTRGRPLYGKILKCIDSYIKNDLKMLRVSPTLLLSRRPDLDPLESIMYYTSVGTPSAVYDTVRTLRQARATRLGALQRKLPSAHMFLLWVLAGIELVSFPLLGAGTQTIGGYNILTVEGVLFGVMTFGIVLTLRTIGELWEGKGGVYNVDGVLETMVTGLEEELDERCRESEEIEAGIQVQIPDVPERRK
eukprot:CAMPEP_0118640098 /NCGR_PEP_ID=MMETSP0785-20121206/4574_1 /TAXON_ID=91992 /ORGANISM="Bolidomonas pacifica, Strain CCMP 1866" /LENGTH=351 /DNA_ID=CAMNT_0006531467 /DNA_START=59 /DNA_END=1114 /DNA_ORIENTATION=+